MSHTDTVGKCWPIASYYMFFFLSFIHHVFILLLVYAGDYKKETVKQWSRF